MGAHKQRIVGQEVEEADRREDPPGTPDDVYDDNTFRDARMFRDEERWGSL